VGYTGMVRPGRRLVVMDPTLAEELPALYRAILDSVARLESAGDRQAAVRIRRDATAAYSRAWDARAQRRLLALLRDADRPDRTERRREVHRSERPAAIAGTVATQDG
jgi:hypothetical protein